MPLREREKETEERVRLETKAQCYQKREKEIEKREWKESQRQKRKCGDILDIIIILLLLLLFTCYTTVGSIYKNQLFIGSTIYKNLYPDGAYFLRCKHPLVLILPYTFALTTTKY